jgi:hypothetical protein
LENLVSKLTTEIAKQGPAPRLALGETAASSASGDARALATL